jgi:uncharacterized membrane protein
MALAQGADRIKRLGFWIAVLGALLGLLLGCADIYMNKIGYGAIVLMIGFPLLAGTAVWCLGWVVEGFSSGPKP